MMRRNGKYMRNGALIAGGITLAVDIIQQWDEKKSKGQPLVLDNLDYWRSLRKTAIAACAGALAGDIYYDYRIYEEDKFPFDSDSYLKKIISEENIKNDPTFFNAVICKRNKIIEWAKKRFGNKLAALPQDVGSFAKRTANAANFDLDLVLIFKTDSYYSLKEMYYDVYDAIYEEFGSIALVEKRTKAITLTYLYNGEEICFDIVPGRLIKGVNMKKNINLYVRPDWVWQKGSSYKTNTQIHTSVLIGKPNARQVIRLLKLYRDLNNLPLPTNVIEHHVLNAMSPNRFGTSSSITENLLNCMLYMGEKMYLKQLPDLSNTNCNLLKSISNLQKDTIAIRLLADLEKVENRASYLKEIFNS